MAAVKQQPSFDVIAEAMNNISRSHAILATHFDRIPNVPAFDGGALILAELRAMREDIGLRFEDVSQQLDEIKQGLQVADFNSVARLENSFLARTADSPLSPLKTAQNQPVNDFPRTLGQIDLLGSEDVNALLTAYGLPTAGLIAVRRGRLRQYIGITIRR